MGRAVITLGTGGGTKRDEFSEQFQRGDHFQSKNLYCRFETCIQGFKEGFSKKNVNRFSENKGGGVKGHMKFFRKFICFVTVTRPLPSFIFKEKCTPSKRSQAELNCALSVFGPSEPLSAPLFLLGARLSLRLLCHTGACKKLKLKVRPSKYLLILNAGGIQNE